MAFEKRYAAIAARLFVSDGKANGEIELGDTTSFKVKQRVVVTAVGEPNLELEVKAVLSDKILKVGPQSSNIRQITDISLYTTAKSAAVLADEQARPGITEVEINRAVYDEEPTVAYRNVLVDQYGQYWGKGNKLPVEADVIFEEISLSSPVVMNIPIANANIKELITIPTTAKNFLIKIRGGNCMGKLFFKDVNSSNYVTLQYGAIFKETGIKLENNLKVFIETSKGNQIVELIYWE